MKPRRVREPFILAIIDQGEKAGDRFCVVAFDVNGNQIPQIQGGQWVEHKLYDHDGVRPAPGKTVWLERPKPSNLLRSPPTEEVA